MYKKIVVFDFDQTLVNTPDPEEGKKIWKEKTGTEWPYNGWWSKCESIDSDIFNINVNDWVYKQYLESTLDLDNYLILATGRLNSVPNMSKYIQRILNENNISFDEIHLNTGGDTFTFKTKLFEDKINELNVSELIIYDDRKSHLEKFKEWSKSMDIIISIIDINKKIII